MEDLISTLEGLIWSNALVFLCLGAGVYFTAVTLFLQVRCLPDMIKQIRSGRTLKREFPRSSR